MGTLHLKFYSCLRLRFPDVETNPGPWRPVAASCRILCSNVRGLSGNLSDLAVASSQYDILLCSETLVSDLRQSCSGESCLVYEMDKEHFENRNLSVVVAKCWLLGFVVLDKTFMCIVFTVILTKMAAYITVY